MYRYLWYAVASTKIKKKNCHIVHCDCTIWQSHVQCCGAENISFGSGSAEPQIRIAASDLAPNNF